jgi:hypothetical protein
MKSRCWAVGRDWGGRKVSTARALQQVIYQELFAWVDLPRGVDYLERNVRSSTTPASSGSSHPSDSSPEDPSVCTRKTPHSGTMFRPPASLAVANALPTQLIDPSRCRSNFISH